MQHEKLIAVRPLYLQVRDEFARCISSGEWKTGRPIPSETQLASILNVSLGTVRKALQNLETSALIVRQQGRGSFVNDDLSAHQLSRFTKLRDVDGKPVLRPFRTRPKVSRGPATVRECEKLQLQHGAMVVRINGHRGTGDQTYLLEYRCLPAARIGRLPKDLMQLTTTSLALLNGILLGRGEERLTVVSARAREAKLFSIKKGNPLLSLDRVICDLQGAPVEWRFAIAHLTKEYYLSELQ